MQFGVHLTETLPDLSVMPNGDDSVHDGPDDGAEKSTRTRAAS
jgi:hypothetical protein